MPKVRYYTGTVLCNKMVMLTKLFLFSFFLFVHISDLKISMITSWVSVH